MSRFADRSVSRIDLGEGDWVDLRSRLTFGDRQAIREALVGGKMGIAPGTPLMLREANVALMLRVIVAWGGPGFCYMDHPHAGDHVPRDVNPENVDALDETGDRIIEEIGKMVQRGTEGFTSTPRGSSSLETRQDSGGGQSTSPSGSTSSRSASVMGGHGESSWTRRKTS